jgi:uncharacterized protein (DUF305 family)
MRKKVVAMPDTVGGRAFSGVAWMVVAAAATTLVVAFGAVSLWTGHGLVPGGMHNNTDFGTADGTRDRMMMSRSMIGTDEATYLVTMIAHHDEAVAAATQLKRSDRSEVRALGEAIVTSQTAQIVQMRSMLEQWHDDAGPAAYVPMMRDLSGLRGDELDRRFLEDMVRHHWMAVMMSRHLLWSNAGVHTEVSNLARDIVREQIGEIRQMSRWLADWFGVRVGMGPMTSRAPERPCFR